MIYRLAHRLIYSNTMPDEHAFLLQRVQPAMVGLIDGSLATLAPIFAVALATHKPHYAFIAGLASAIAAGVSMAYSEGLSDTGELTGRGHPIVRGAITGFGTFEAKQRKARTGRNPRTGQSIRIAATKTPAFRAGKGLKDGIQ